MNSRQNVRASAVAKLPGVGRLLRMLKALWLLPESRRALSKLQNRLKTLEARQAAIKEAQAAQRQDIKQLARSVPVALRSTTRELADLRGQFGGILARLDRQSDLEEHLRLLQQRIEFVRRELMFEMRYGASPRSTTASASLTTEAEVLNPEKLEAARNGELRVNLGCGHVTLDGYINVDRRGLPGVDIVAEVEQLPLKEGEVDEIFSAHLLEHFPQEQLRRELLPYWHGLLKSNGVLRGVVPDADAMISAYAAGDFPYGDLREVTFGAQDYDGDFHFNMFAPDQLQELLTEAGFTQVEWTARGRRNGSCLEMEFTAVRP